MKTEFTIIDTTKEKITESRKGYIELFPTHLKLIVDFSSSEIGEDAIPGSTHNYFNNRTIDKNAITEICLFRASISENWCVEVTHRNDSACVQFKEYAPAKKLYYDLIEWKYPHPSAGK